MSVVGQSRHGRNSLKSTFVRFNPLATVLGMGPKRHYVPLATATHLLPTNSSLNYRGGIWISSSSCALVSSVAVNFIATASLTITSSPVIRSGSMDGRGKKSSRVRLAFASEIFSHSEYTFSACRSEERRV